MKINFHFTQWCNFSCSYCFVTPMDKFKLNINYIKILNKLSNHFEEINIVGGEPTIVEKDFNEIVKYTRTKFKKMDLMTNGFNILKDKNKYNINEFNTIGISIDFFDKANNNIIGRKTQYGESLDIDDYIKIKKIIKSVGAKFKINLMVSKLNYKKNFKEELKLLNPDRLKILAIMSIDNNKEAEKLSVTKEEFDFFCKINNLEKSNKIVIEGPGDMINAYYMINGEGDMFINNNFKTKVIGNWLTDDGNELMKLVNVNKNKYLERY